MEINILLIETNISLFKSFINNLSSSRLQYFTFILQVELNFILLSSADLVVGQFFSFHQFFILMLHHHFISFNYFYSFFNSFSNFNINFIQFLLCWINYQVDFFLFSSSSFFLLLELNSSIQSLAFQLQPTNLIILRLHLLLIPSINFIFSIFQYLMYLYYSIFH